MLRSKRRARDFVDDQAEEEDEQRYRRGQGQQNRVRWAERVDKEECSPPRGPRHGAPSFALDENEEEEDEDEAHFVKVSFQRHSTNLTPRCSRSTATG